MKLDLRLASCKRLEEVASFKNIDGRKTQVQKLVEDLRQMVNNPECSDFAFICKDGERIHACRMLLVARSAILRQMLTNGMAESKQTEIFLPEISSPVLLEILRFLYAGELCDEDLSSAAAEGDGHMPGNRVLHLGWTSMVEVIIAARFLMLDSLENVVLNRLWYDLPSREIYTEEMLRQTASRLSVVCEYPSLLSGGTEVESVDFICLRLVQILISHDLSVGTLRELSEKAIHYYLENTKSRPSDETWKISFKEYVRLWQLLTWCVIQTEDEDGLSTSEWICLPEPSLAWSLIEEPDGAYMSTFRSIDLSRSRLNVVNRIPQHMVEKLLPLVDLTCIHPELLVGIIEPLGIIDLGEYTRVLGFQAIKGSRWLRNDAKRQVSCSWHFPPVDTSNKSRPCADSLALSNVDSLTVKVGLAHDTSEFAFTAMADVEIGPYGTYQWSITVLALCGMVHKNMGEFEIGFMSLEYGEGMVPSNKRLSDDSRAWVMKVSRDLRRATFKSRGQQIDPVWVLSPGKKFQWNSPIQFELNRPEKTCTISYAEDTFSLPYALENFSSGLFYPAVDCSMIATEFQYSHRQGFTVQDFISIRLELIKGFSNELVSKASKS